jgi:hypothetical protein
MALGMRGARRRFRRRRPLAKKARQRDGERQYKRARSNRRQAQAGG